jgi:perosamine synthetase
VCWLYSILIDERQVGISRDDLIMALKREGIETRPFFYPLHLMPPFLGHNKDFPVSREVSGRGISFPSSYNLSTAEVERVAANLTKIINHSKSPAMIGSCK